ncbi:MAG: efflux RND transporter periplasmic adaptor subunit [Gemmatimonadetes bacterium]|nr:efflux RND transporter periplasmic adaptor subunit [Gemmatimonadota bacterium]
MKHFIPMTLVLAVASCTASEPGELATSDQGADVAVSRAVVSPGFESYPATLVPTERADLATRMSGTIRRIRVDVGSEVSSGQVLAELDASDIEARIAAAEANTRLARRSFDRIENLAADGAASQQELDEVTARQEAAEAGLRDARAQASYAVLRAPFDGVVVARMAHPGDLAAPGRPLLSLLGRKALKVEADLPADMAGKVQVGDELSVFFPSLGSRVAVGVTRVVPALTPGSRRFRIEARLLEDLPGEGSVVPGAYVRLVLQEQDASRQWIPADAVVRRGQLTGVFTVEDSELRLRWVRLGESSGDAIELLAGPIGSSPVVRRPGPDLYDGRAVSSVREEPFLSGDAVAEQVPEEEVAR